VKPERSPGSSALDRLPASVEVRAALRAIADRARVASDRRPGIGSRGECALLAGGDAAARTAAASAIAGELGLELLRVDLSAVVSKYIGETEKNLARLFERAERSSVVLFFDEADALFGKRTGVKDAHDRYANLEVNYLLQRIEGFGGLAILAANSEHRIDPAFFRRVAAVVKFPKPPKRG
jgi:SpoVK/Ycf46/Vps4 family AAA+-type ATPase